MKLISSMSSSTSTWSACWYGAHTQIRKAITAQITVLMVVTLVGCDLGSENKSEEKEPKTEFTLQVDQENATVTGNVRGMNVSDTLLRLDQQLGVRVRAVEPPNTTVDLTFNQQPIEAAIQAIVGPQTRFTIDLVWGDVALPSPGEKETRQKTGEKPSKPRSELPTKGKTGQLDPNKLELVKKSDDKREVITDGSRGTKPRPVDVKGITEANPKKPKKAVAISGRYARLRIEVTQTDVRPIRVWMVEGPLVEPVHVSPGLVLAIIRQGRVTALTSVPDPLIERSYNQQGEGHSVHLLDRAQAVLSLSESAIEASALENSEIHIYRIPEDSPVHLSVENFSELQKQLAELGRFHGKVLTKLLQ